MKGTKRKGKKEASAKTKAWGRKIAGLFREISNSSRFLKHKVNEKAETERGRNNGPLCQVKEPEYHLFLTVVMMMTMTAATLH